MSTHAVIYTKPNCIQCKMTKQLFEKHNYPFVDNYHGNKNETNEIDLNSKDPKKAEWSQKKIISLKQKTKLKQMPIVKIRDDDTGEILDTWGGFNPQKIKEWSKNNE